MYDHNPIFAILLLDQWNLQFNLEDFQRHRLHVKTIVYNLIRVFYNLQRSFVN